jgi:hypothetical protein
MVQIKLKYVNGFANRDRRNQRVRYYFRRHGTKAIPLPGLPGSEEFMVAYAAALASVPDQHLEIAANLDRSVGPFPLPRVLWHLPNRCSGAIDDRACTQHARRVSDRRSGDCSAAQVRARNEERRWGAGT